MPSETMEGGSHAGRCKWSGEKCFGCFQFKQICREVCQHNVAHVTMLYMHGVQHEESNIWLDIKMIKAKQGCIYVRIKTITMLQENHDNLNKKRTMECHDEIF